MGASKKTSLFLLAVWMLCIATPTAYAKTDSFSVLKYWRSNPNDGLYSFSSEVLPKSGWELSTYFDYSYHPLELFQNGARSQGVVDHLLVQHIQGAYGLNDRWTIELDLPVILINRFITPTTPAPARRNEFGIGDLKITNRFQILSEKEHFIGISFIPYGTLPLGNENHFISEKSPTGGALLAFDKSFGDSFYMTINIGAEGRERIEFNNVYNTQSKFFASSSARLDISERLSLVEELTIETSLINMFGSKAITPGEILGGIQYKTDKGFYLKAAIGTAIIRGGGAPVARGLFSLSYTGRTNPEKSRAYPPRRHLSYMGHTDQTPSTPVSKLKAIEPAINKKTNEEDQQGKIVQSAHPEEQKTYIKSSAKKVRHSQAKHSIQTEKQLDTTLTQSIVKPIEKHEIKQVQATPPEKQSELVFSEVKTINEQAIPTPVLENKLEERQTALSMPPCTEQNHAVYFNFDSAKLTLEEAVKLGRIADQIEQNSQTTVQIIGHSSPEGSKAYNLALSQKRANAVVRYLSYHGIKKDKFKTFNKGEGQAKPKQDQKKARRADIFWNTKEQACSGH